MVRGRHGGNECLLNTCSEHVKVLGDSFNTINHVDDSSHQWMQMTPVALDKRPDMRSGTGPKECFAKLDHPPGEFFCDVVETPPPTNQDHEYVGKGYCLNSETSPARLPYVQLAEKCDEVCAAIGWPKCVGYTVLEKNCMVHLRENPTDDRRLMDGNVMKPIQNGGSVLSYVLGADGSKGPHCFRKTATNYGRVSGYSLAGRGGCRGAHGGLPAVRARTRDGRTNAFGDVNQCAAFCNQVPPCTPPPILPSPSRQLSHLLQSQSSCVSISARPRGRSCAAPASVLTGASAP